MFIIFKAQEEIKYLDVDKNNKLTNKAIINFMQETAGGHSEKLHDGLNDKEKIGTAWILLNWRVKVYFRPRYKDILQINTWVRKQEKCFSYREFEIYCKNELVAKAETKWVLVNVKTEKITKIPEELSIKYEANGEKVFEDDMNEKLTNPKDSKLMYEEIVPRTKIDTNNHLNNIYYLDLAMESLPEEVYENEALSNIEIMYKKASTYKQKLLCYYKKEEEKHIVVIEDEKENIHAIINLW